MSSNNIQSYGFKPLNLGRIVIWSLFALALIVAPLLFKSSLALTMLSQIGYLIIICLSYNMLLGQGGMLSFGHAVYTGLGSFLAIHAMNMAGKGMTIPVSLIPIVGGGLATINFEIVTGADSLSVIRSGGYLLFTFLGGATFFFGPIIGAVLLVFASVLLSELSKAWLLYLGLVFLFMVMYAPGGIASLVMLNVRLARFGRLKPLLSCYLGMALTGSVVVLGAASMIEMLYHLQLNAALGPEMEFLHLRVNAEATASWLCAGAVLAVGLGLFELVRRRFVARWHHIQEEIEKEIKRTEAH